MNSTELEELLCEEFDSYARGGEREQFYSIIAHALERCVKTLNTNTKEALVLRCARESLYTISRFGGKSADSLMEYFEGKLWRAKMIGMDYEPLDSQPDLIQAFRRTSIPFTKDYKEKEVVWVPSWAKKATELYKDSGGYADLRFWKFLNKMKPIDDDEDVDDRAPAGPTTRKGKRRREKMARLKVRMGR